MTSCLKKLGKNVSREDREALQALASQLRKDGLGNDAAAIAAVRAHDGSLGTMEKALEAESAAAKAMPAQAAQAQQKPASDDAEASLDAQLAQQLALDKPDLQVILPGTDAPISVREALARIADEQRQDAQWADLVQVAAECSLSAGAA